jgi:cytochrome c551/c552
MIKITLKYSIFLILPAFVLAFVIAGCSSQDEEIGIGPVKEVSLAAIDKNLVDKGKTVFDTKCASCHKFDTKLVGPPLKDVTKRRKPEWIMNMILNPQQMTQENQAAKELFTTYLVQMTFQDVSHDDARALLEYFRALDDGSQTLK